MRARQAAGIPNVSWPTLVGLVDKGVLAARMVGNQRRPPLAAVLASKAEVCKKRSAALDEMVAIAQEYNFP